jgi:ribosomal protein S18 acetylase RimI-like enzyme
MTPLVREAREAEAGVVAALINAINSLDDPPRGWPMTAEVVRRDLLGAQPRAMLRVAELANAVVGFATAGRIYDAGRQADALMLLDLYVAPEARRRGAARALMARLAAEARRDGAACLWWGVDEGDDEALLFYAPSARAGRSASAAKSWTGRQWNGWQTRHEPGARRGGRPAFRRDPAS